MTDWSAALDTAERETCGDPPVNLRICPECDGRGEVELSGGHDPYTGERTYIDTCPECDGEGEIEVEPVDEDDIAEIPEAGDGE